MTDMICVLLIYYLEIINLCAASEFIYGIKFKRNLAVMAAVSGTGVVLLDYYVDKILCFGLFPFLVFIFGYLFSVCTLEKKENKLTMLSVALIIKMVSMILWLFGVAVELIKYDNYRYRLALLFITGMITSGILIFILITKKRGRTFVPVEHTKKELLFLISGETALLLVLFVVTEFTVHFSPFKIVGIPVITASVGIIIFICYHMLSVKYENRLMKIEHDSSVRMLSAQEDYYKMLLDKEEQTRAFRHDIRSHLYCMKALCDRGEYVQLKEYIDKLNGEHAEVKNTASSGNELVDIIINDMMSKHSSVKLKIFGTFSHKHLLEMPDLCTVFSNLIENAFESAEKNDDQTVIMHIKRLDSNLYISIQNTVIDIPLIENNNIKTSKSDTGHGYGIRNVKTCLDKYGGMLELRCEENIFEANVMIPNILEE